MAPWLLWVAVIAEGVGGLVVVPKRGVPRWPARRGSIRKRTSSPVAGRPAWAAATETQDAKRSMVSVLWRFSRPHTLIGTMLCVPALHALAAPSAAACLTGQFWSSLTSALVPACLVNVFITGLNQLSDVDIDKVNKPHLPVAAGDLSEAQGAAICAACLSVAALLALTSPFASQPLCLVLGGSAALGAAYSLPPVRLKRWPLLAAISIVAVRGALVNYGFYHHAVARAFEGTAFVPRPPADAHLGLVVAFFGIFGVAIALMKDVPDVEGDRRFNIPTLSTILGRRRVFLFAGRIVAGLFAAAAATFGVAAIQADSPALVGVRLVAALAAASLAKDAAITLNAVDTADKASVTRHYMRVWKLFYLAYVGLPFAR